MRPSIALVVLLFSLLPMASAHATDSIACAKANCEPQGSTCITTLYATYDACMSAGRKTCNAVMAADKMDCLKRELTVCATARNQAEDACLADARTCQAACVPEGSTAAGWWCVADLGKSRIGAFCATDPAAPRSINHCAREFQGGNASAATLTCESL